MLDPLKPEAMCRTQTQAVCKSRLEPDADEQLDQC